MRVLIVGGPADGMIRFRGAMMRQMQDLGCTITILCPEQPYPQDCDWFDRHQIDYEVAPLARTGTNPWHDVVFYRYLVKTMRRVKPGMLFAYTHKPIIFGAWAAKKTGVEHINAMVPGLGYGFSGQGGVKNRLVFKAITAMHRRTKRLIDNLFFLNDTDYEDFRRLDLIGKDTHATVLPGEGKDLEGFAFAPPMDAAKPPRFNLITRILREKGVPDFVEVAGLVKEEFPDAQFDLIGPYDSNPGAIGPEAVKQWEDDGKIIYQGVTLDVPSFLRDCTATVLPTTYREGLPMVLLEAMAIGRPVVAYQNAGATQSVESPEEIEPGLFQGTNGFLIEPGRVDLLAKALLMLCRDPGLVERMGLAGRRFAEARFDVLKVNDTILRQIGLLK